MRYIGLDLSFEVRMNFYWGSEGFVYKLGFDDLISWCYCLNVFFFSINMLEI